MKRLLLASSFLAALSLTACGDKGGGGGVSHGSGAAGTWVLDNAAFFENNRELFAESHADADKARLKEIEAMPAEARDAARKAFKEEQAALEKVARERASKVHATFTVKGDNTWSGVMESFGPKEEDSGTWSQNGDKITFTTTTKNGKPAEGEDAKPMTLTLKGDRLSGKPEEKGPMLVFVRQ